MFDGQWTAGVAGYGSSESQRFRDGKSARLMFKTSAFQDISLEALGTLENRQLKDLARKLKAQSPGVPAIRLELCLDVLRRSNDKSSQVGETEAAAGAHTEKWLRDYCALSALYMLLMPAVRRQKLAAYFTPSHLCSHIIKRLEGFGLKIGTHTVLDPACGGAAFLVPIAIQLAAMFAQGRLSQAEIETCIARLLAGIEVEPGLAALSEAMIAHIFSRSNPALDNLQVDIIERANSLKLDRSEISDAVIANPPYGRVYKASPGLKSKWADVISDGHINTYALFVAQSIAMAKQGGLIALVIPTSITAGPYFANLRRHVLKSSALLGIDLIDKRSDAFIDVIQDACVVYLRKHERDRTAPSVTPNCCLIREADRVERLGPIEIAAEEGGVWALPTPDNQDNTGRANFFDKRLRHLDAFGYEARAGYFVWNRSLDRMQERPQPIPGEVPLIWARNIKAGAQIRPLSRAQAHAADAPTMSCVRIEAGNQAVVRKPSIVLQRTTNRNQRRRLVAGLITGELVDQYGGVVTENHTIVIAPRDDLFSRIPVETMLVLINSEAVDQRFRQICSTVSVSTKILRKLPLPNPEDLMAAVAEHGNNEHAVEVAYEATLSRPE